MRWALASFSLSALLLGGSAARAAPDPARLMERADRQHRIATEKLQATMVLQKKNGPQRRREMIWIGRQDDRQGDRSLIRFTSPANIKNTAMLSIENVGGEDDQWLYLPAFRRTRRVGAGELGDRFAGSDIYNEDLRRRRPRDYRYTLRGSERVDGRDCWVIESRPRAAKVVKESPYAKSVHWLRKDINLVVQTRHFDRRMRPLKQIQMLNLRKVAGRAWRADKQVFFDVRRKHRTVILITKRQTNVRLPSGIFSRQTLKSFN